MASSQGSQGIGTPGGLTPGQGGLTTHDGQPVAPVITGSVPAEPPTSVASTPTAVLFASNVRLHNIAQKTFVDVIRAYQSDHDLDPTKFRTLLNEDYPPELLFDVPIAMNFALMRKLADFLPSVGIQLAHSEPPSTLHRIAQSLYSSGPELETACAKIGQLRHSLTVTTEGEDGNNVETQSTENEVPRESQKGQSSKFASEQNISSRTSRPDTYKQAHNMATRFKDESSKFSGALGECWDEFVEDYVSAADDYALDEGQRLQFLHHILRGNAKRYFNREVKQRASEFTDAIHLMEGYYNSTSRQTRIENHLNSLRLEQFLDSANNASDALEKLDVEISTLAPQGPLHCRNPQNKVSYLRKAVIGHSWSREPLSRAAAQGLTYQELLSQLESSIQQEKEEKAALARMTPRSRFYAPAHLSKSQSILYQGQARYGREKTKVTRRQDEGPVCFNCGSPDHMLRKCLKDLDTAAIAARKVQFYEQKNTKTKTNPLSASCLRYVNSSSTLPNPTTKMPRPSVTWAKETPTRSKPKLPKRKMKSRLLRSTLLITTTRHLSQLLGGFLEGSTDSYRQDTPKARREELGISPARAVAGRRRRFAKKYGPIIEVLHNVAEDIYLSNATQACTFHGGCLDSGAQRCVIGKAQAKAYCTRMGLTFSSKVSPIRYRLGRGIFKGIGSIPVRICTPRGRIIKIQVDVIDADIPLLLGLDFMDRWKVVPDNVDNLLMFKNGNYTMPIVRKFGHMYLEWHDYAINFTKTELRKMHLHFYHPTVQKLFNLMKRAKPEQANPETRKLLEQVTKACETCQRFSPKPQRFKVSFPKDVVFNQEIALDLMWIDQLPVLHVVDLSTHFSAAEFVGGQSLEAVWNAFLSCWATVYTGYPDAIRADQGSVFTSGRWKDLMDNYGIEFNLSGVESHNSLGAGERYHAPLRRIYQKIRHNHPSLDLLLSLKLAIKAMNDTMNPEGLVPSLLVFGVLPRFPGLNTALPHQQDRMQALMLARYEMEVISNELRLQKALQSKIPEASSFDLEVRQKVLVYREDEKPSPWTGPYRVSKLEGKQVFIERNGTQVQHSVTQVKPYEEGDTCSESPSQFVDVLHTMIESLSDSRHEPTRLYLTEVLHPRDPRGNSAEFTEAKRKEIRGLQEKGTWKIVVKEEVPKDANILTGRFVLAIKNANTDEEIYKARYVAQGHRDKDKNFLVHNSTTLRQSSVRVMMAIAAICGFRVWSHDVSQAYLQSGEALMRKVYIKPSKEFELSSNQLLELLKPLYGLPDSGDYWNQTMLLHLKNDLGMTQTVGDISLFFKYIHERLSGMTGSYVDDSLHVGNDAFQKLSDKSLQKFESRDRVFDNMKFAGVDVRTTAKGFELGQEEYVRKLSILPLDCTFSDFRSKRAKLAWATHTRPDICFMVNQFAQVTEDRFNSQHVKQLNKVIKYLQVNPKRGLKFHKLDKASLRLKTYADSSFANNEDQSSQLGFIVLLTDKSNRCNILHYSRHKSRRVIRSVLGGEVYAFADAFDFSHTLQYDLQAILNQKIPLSMFTDSKSLFDVITKASSTAEKRLMIDITAVRNAYENQEISDVGFIRSQHNPADAFAKPKTNAALERILQSGECQHPVEQWVIRDWRKSTQ